MESDFAGMDPMAGAPMGVPIQPVMGMPVDQGSTIKRDVEKPAPARAALVKDWIDKVLRAKKHWKKPFDRMREDMDFYMGKQWSSSDTDDRYVANIVQRHVAQRVSQMYAKNPKFTAKRRDTLDFAVWDGEMSSIQNVQTVMMASDQTGMPPDPMALQLVEDIKQGYDKRRMLEKVAKTMEIVAHHQIQEQQPVFKGQMKQLVRRTCVTGVGFLKLGYNRVMEKRPEDVEKITDITEQITMIERLTADRTDAIFTDEDKRLEQLRLMLKDLQAKQDVIVREGVVFDFPLSPTIIPDTKCRQLNGFVGAEWVAQEFILDVEEVKEIYKVDLGKAFTAYQDPNGGAGDDDRKSVVVWEIYSKKDGLLYVVADGYHEFLKEPAAPPLALERFWPFFSLIFNEVESDKDIYPPSDVRLLMPVQREYNRARQSLREHRFANRPAYATYDGALSEKDIINLQSHPANAVIRLNNLNPGQAVNSILQPIQHSPIDAALYDTSMLLDDMMRLVGSQEANLGGTGGSTATEVSVAEGSRMSSLSSNVDDIEDFLSDLARATGQVLLLEMDEMTVKKIAGPGAVWPHLTSAEVAQELFLEVEAGSNGRPNKAIQIQNFERLAPTLLQIPGISPEWLAREAIKRLDDGMDVKDAIASGLQSIVAMNSAKSVTQSGMGDPATDPAMQGGAGAMNAPAPMVAPGADGPAAPPSPAQIRANGVPGANV
jgi:hypothetical protein